LSATSSGLQETNIVAGKWRPISPLLFDDSPHFGNGRININQRHGGHIIQLVRVRATEIGHPIIVYPTASRRELRVPHAAVCQPNVYAGLGSWKYSALSK